MTSYTRNFPIYGCVSFASGREADVVQSMLHQAAISDFQSVALGGARMSALSELDSFYHNAQRLNWDGEDGLPVHERAYGNARRFLSIMPRTWVKPDVSADPDGEVSVEWRTGPRKRFSLSIGPDDRVSYAWLNGSERGNGTDTFADKIPSGITSQVERLVAG